MSQHFVKTDIQVRFNDFDVLGHLNNATYSTYIELARVHFFQEVLGMDLTQITGVVSNFNIDFKRPIRFGTPISVLSRAETECGRFVNMTFQFANASDVSKVYAQATQRMVAVDPQTSQLTNLPKRIQRDMELLMNGEQAHPAVVMLGGADASLGKVG